MIELPALSEGVIVAGIGAFAAVIASAFGAIAAITSSRASSHAKRAAVAGRRTAHVADVIREQVQNDHTTNLREEADDRHSENTGNFGLVMNALEAMRADVGGLRSDIRQLYRQDSSIRDDLESIRGDTIPKGSPLWEQLMKQKPTPDSEA